MKSFIKTKKKKSPSKAKPVIAAVAASAGLAVTGVVAARRGWIKTSNGTNGKTTESTESRSRRTYHLVPNGDGWVVKPEGSSDIVIREDTKREALDTAGQAMARLAPSQLVVHRKDGTIEEFRNFEPETSN